MTAELPSGMLTVEPTSSPAERDEEPSKHLEALLAKPIEQPYRATPSLTEIHAQSRIDGVVIGHLIGFDGANQYLVDFWNNPTKRPLEAVGVTPLGREHIGREVALSFVDGDPRRPIILGRLYTGSENEALTGHGEVHTADIVRDDQRLTISAENEIVLRCGESSITLTKAGKVLIRGKYVLSRSSGVNRIKGGAVQIN